MAILNYIDIGMDFLENIDVDMDLQNIDIYKILNQLEFGLSTGQAGHDRFTLHLSDIGKSKRSLLKTSCFCSTAK